MPDSRSDVPDVIVFPPLILLAVLLAALLLQWLVPLGLLQSVPFAARIGFAIPLLACGMALSVAAIRTFALGHRGAAVGARHCARHDRAVRLDPQRDVPRGLPYHARSGPDLWSGLDRAGHGPGDVCPPPWRDPARRALPWAKF